MYASPRGADLTRCNHAGHDSEVYLVPQRIYKDPFRGGDNIIVMADTYEPPRLQADGSLSELKVRSLLLQSDQLGVHASAALSAVLAEGCKRSGVMGDGTYASMMSFQAVQRE